MGQPSGFRWARPGWQYQPTRTTHDPNPPITLENAPVGGTDALLANDLTSGTPTLTSPAIGQTHVLNAADLTGAVPTLTAPALGITGQIPVLVRMSGKAGMSAYPPSPIPALSRLRNRAGTNVYPY